MKFLSLILGIDQIAWKVFIIWIAFNDLIVSKGIKNDVTRNPSFL